MANYSFEINSKFDPFSYADFVAPLKDATTAHQKIEEDYTNLESSAETLRARAEKEALKNPNSTWLKKYNAYMSDLNNAVSDLAHYGLQPGIRMQVRNARKNYYNSIDPVVKAIAQQQKLSDSQYAQNPALRMVYGDMPTIDQLIGDMTIKPVSYSGQDVYTQAATSAKAVSSREQLNTFLKNQMPGYIMQVKRVGFKDNPRTIEDMLKHKEIKAIVNNVSQQFGNFEGLNDANKKKMQGEILKGLLDGVVYREDKQLQYDQYAAELRTIERERRAKQEAANQATNQAAEAQLNAALQGIIPMWEYDKNDRPDELRYAKYFDQKGRITEKGKQEYRKQITLGTEPSNILKTKPITLRSAFYQYINKLARKKFGTKSYSFKDVEDLFAEVKNKRFSGDARRNQIYVQQLDNSTSEAWQRALSIGNNKLQEVKYTKDGYKVQDSATPDKVFKDYENISLSTSSKGFTFIVHYKDKSTKQFKIPTTLSSRFTTIDNATQLLKLVEKYGAKLNETTNNTVALEEEDKKLFNKYGFTGNSFSENDLQSMLNQVYINAFETSKRAITTNKTKPVETEAF
jgi:predicted transcriptional regulator